MMENRNFEFTLDYNSVCDDVEGILDVLRSMSCEKHFEAVLGAEALRRINEQDRAIRKRLDEAFNVVVVGDFKRGKSTLINALLGEQVLPAAVTPETVTINKVSYSEKPKAAIVLKNGKRTTVSFNDLNRETIERVAPELPAQIDWVDLQVDADILREISIIDTPGIGDLLKEFDERVTKYLINADAIIYVVSARAPLSETERAFLSSSVMPESFPQVFLVINMSDTLETPENISRIKNMTKERANDISTNISVYAISGLDELCRKKGLKRPNPELAALLEESFLEFETALESDIIAQKDVIKATRGIKLTHALLDSLLGELGLIKSMLKLSYDEMAVRGDELRGQNSALANKLSDHKEELSRDIEKMCLESQKWMFEFMGRLEAEIKSFGETAKLNELERHFQFYMSDLIRSAAQRCVEQHRQEISEKLSLAAKGIALDIVQISFGTADGHIADCIADISFTIADYTVIFSEILLESTFIGVLAVGFVQGVRGIIRGTKPSGKEVDFLEPVLEKFESIKADVADSLREAYKKMKLDVINCLDNVYQRQLEASVSAIEQAKSILEDEGASSASASEYIDLKMERVSELSNRLNKYH